MAWKFLSIKNANEEIARLEAELAAKGSPAAAPSADQLASFEKRLNDLAASVSALGEQVAGQIKDAAQLESQAAATSDRFTIEIARIDKALADATPEKIGSRIAAEITSRQGQAPLNAGATTGTTNSGAGIEEQLQAIEDPVKRARFFSEHQKEINARMIRNGNGHASRK